MKRFEEERTLDGGKERLVVAAEGHSEGRGSVGKVERDVIVRNQPRNLNH